MRKHTFEITHVAAYILMLLIKGQPEVLKPEREVRLIEEKPGKFSRRGRV